MYARTLVLVGLVAAAAPLGGCDGPGTPQRFARHLGPIRGGQISAEMTAVVGIVVQTPEGAAICSGSLIAPNLVLTAQHCVARISSPYVECGNTPFGQLYRPDAFYVTTDARMNFEGGGRYYAVREVKVPVQFADTCGHDIGVLVLDQNVAAGEARPLDPRLDAFPAVGERFSAIGYGHVGDETGSGTRRVIHDRQFLCAGPSCAGNEGVTAAELVGNDGTCQGDSGGPALDAQGRVLGALSRGGEGCSYPTYSATAAWSEWLQQMGVEAAQVGGYAPPAWTGAAPADLDADGLPDAEDNCPSVPNFEQADLDADGLGDACDPRLDRDCSVCQPCQGDAACGPGAYCSGTGQCFMGCAVDADCPDAGTTVCADYSGRRVCVNRDHQSAGLCAAGFECGVSLAPVPEPEPLPEPQEPEPDEPESPSEAPPLGGELPEVPGPEAEAPEVTVLGGPVTLQGGCSAASTPSDTPAGLALGLLLGLRLRRRRRRRG